ncbi:DUF1173 family protein [Nocardia takedensis]|uniref:DUF1173 family protein n=1 Tax=Nocardia takedensis TaxID=259390 RepID=UPI003F761B31
MIAQVRLAGRQFTLVELRENPDRHARFFEQARAERVGAQCLCRAEGPRLVIRCSRAGRYHLARWPGEGELHAPLCPFHHIAIDPEHSGRSTYARGAIRETATGTAISFATPLTTTTKPPADTKPATNDSAGASRRTVGLLALLHWMWEQAGLTSWSPGRGHTSWADCVREIDDRITDCTINRQPLADLCYLVPPFTRVDAEANAADFDRFLADLGTDNRGLVAGEIKKMSPTDYGVAYHLTHLRRRLYANTGLDARIRTSHPAVFSRVADQMRVHRVGLFLVQRSPNGHPLIADAAAMLTTRLWIPADSSHEVTMADALTAAGRTYTKPLRYDATEETFPDFVLTDTRPHTLVEVWGVRGRESYEQRKAAKQEIYRAQNAPLLEWTVTQPLPNVNRPPSPVSGE